VSSSISHPYEWLKTLPSSVLHFEDLPSIGHSPPFPWKALSETLSGLFEQPFEIKPRELQSRPAEELLLGLKDALFKKYVAIHPLEGYACFILPKSAIRHLIDYLIKKEDAPLDQFDEDFQESFATFLSLEVLHTISHLDFDAGLSYRLLEEAELPQEPALCLDIDIILPKQTLPGRLILSAELSKSWKERYSEQQFDLLLNSAIARKVPITVHLEGGRVELTQEELKQLKAGDFLILDSCTLQPGDNKGRVMLMVNQQPFMRGKIKDGTLKLLEFPVLEAGAAMANDDEPKEEEPIEEEPESEEAEPDLEELDFEEQEFSEIEGLELEQKAEVEKEIEAEPAAEPTAALAKISPETLPITIVVEVGRLQITLQKLLELQPGSILELDLSPQSGVDLMVNGKRIGRGELLAIGETLGVRILEI
jgi:flagellar motor switch protein FliN